MEITALTIPIQVSVTQKRWPLKQSIFNNVTKSSTTSKSLDWYGKSNETVSSVKGQGYTTQGSVQAVSLGDPDSIVSSHVLQAKLQHGLENNPTDNYRLNYGLTFFHQMLK